MPGLIPRVSMDEARRPRVIMCAFVRTDRGIVHTEFRAGSGRYAASTHDETHISYPRLKSGEALCPRLKNSMKRYRLRDGSKNSRQCCFLQRQGRPLNRRRVYPGEICLRRRKHSWQGKVSVCFSRYQSFHHAVL